MQLRHPGITIKAHPVRQNRLDFRVQMAIDRRFPEGVLFTVKVSRSKRQYNVKECL